MVFKGQADAASSDGAFSAGLLNPASPVPQEVKGQPTKRFSVYRNNVTASLARALAANFPAVQRLLGEAYFAGLARQFVQEHPPDDRLLFLYGATFSGFLSTRLDLLDFPYLADVAALEQQWRVSHHEADAPILHASALMDMDGDEMLNLCFVPHPAGALLKSCFAIHAIFEANRGVGAPVADPASAESVLVTRPYYEVQTRHIDAGMFSFLQTLWRGASLGDAAEQGAAAEVDFDLTSAIAMMLESGAFQSTAD